MRAVDRKTTLSRKLRRDSTDAERRLWGVLKGRELECFKFRRQHPLGPYVVDFVNKERTDWLTSEGYHVLRFWNNEVLGNLDGVWYVIEEKLKLLRVEIDRTPSS